MILVVSTDPSSIEIEPGVIIDVPHFAAHVVTTVLLIAAGILDSTLWQGLDILCSIVPTNFAVFVAIFAK